MVGSEISQDHRLQMAVPSLAHLLERLFIALDRPRVVVVVPMEIAQRVVGGRLRTRVPDFPRERNALLVALLRAFPIVPIDRIADLPEREDERRLVARLAREVQRLLEVPPRRFPGSP